MAQFDCACLLTFAASKGKRCRTSSPPPPTDPRKPPPALVAQGRTVGTSAAQWLVDTVNASPGEVSVLALGPLTNIALALQLDERVTHNMVRRP